MAEFAEVMCQATRMCEYYERSRTLSCTQCPLSRVNARCGHSLCLDIGSINAEEAAEIEHAVMAWAAEHPAQRYPTWNEWQDSTFPNRSRDVSPCEFDDGNRFNCEAKECEKCMNEPIPADIAAKLGIKPIEEG